jgi:hypothetical protein
MRWILVAAVLAFSTVDICAAEPVSDEAQSVVDMTEPAQGTTISAIPMPLPVVEVLNFDDPVAKQRARKLRLAKKKPTPVLMLTRTERRQVALLTASTQSSGPQGFTYDPNDNDDDDLDELVLHRSYSRPKIVDEPADADVDKLPGHIRLRLLFARLKALEAQALSQVPDTDEALPDSVVLRLREARLKAVAAHQKKFG